VGEWTRHRFVCASGRRRSARLLFFFLGFNAIAVSVDIGGGAISALGIAFAFGLGLALAITALGHVSGGHFSWRCIQSRAVRSPRRGESVKGANIGVAAPSGARVGIGRHSPLISLPRCSRGARLDALTDQHSPAVCLGFFDGRIWDLAPT
jgi:hypothetical protein